MGPVLAGDAWETNICHVSNPSLPLPFFFFFFPCFRAGLFMFPSGSTSLLVGVPCAFPTAMYSSVSVVYVVYVVYERRSSRPLPSSTPVLVDRDRRAAPFPSITSRNRCLSLTSIRLASHSPRTKFSRSRGLLFQFAPPGNVFTMSSSTSLRFENFSRERLSVYPLSSSSLSITFPSSFTISRAMSPSSGNSLPTNVDAYTKLTQWGNAIGATSLQLCTRPLR
mmetsp:Transcript_13093/g.37778  ORF Transcript_13093/g.37778 Transcript_13093/m.37778 type:complete len:223 (+) Transcript_13093:267-935(+)